MTIVSSIVAEDGSEQASTGVKYLRFEFTDHEGKVYGHFGYGKYPIATDSDTKRLELVPKLETALDETEQKEAWGSEDPLVLTLAPSHSTQKKIAKYIVRQLMLTRDVEDIIRAKSFLLYLNANFTDQQLRNLLDITQSQLTSMRTKVKRIWEDTYAGETYEDIISNVDAVLEVEEWD